MAPGPMEDPLERRVRELMAVASRAWVEGRAAEAQRILHQVEAEAPRHPVALNEAAKRRIAAGDLAAAKAVLDQAVAIDPSLAFLWESQARVAEALNLPEAEKAALDRLLALDPRHLGALLQAGAWHERRGEGPSAAAVYRRALESVPRGIELSSRQRADLQQAHRVVEANKAALERFLEDRLAPLRARHGDRSLRRFDTCMATVLQKQPIYRQKPTFMYFPELPAIAFHDRDRFPWLDTIEAATADIRAEFLKVLAEDADGVQPYVQGAPAQGDVWSELSGSRRWSIYYLWRMGVACAENLARCPRTAEALRVWPQCELKGSGPSAVFSILDAKTHIPPHTGVNNARLFVHLPLIVPPDCRFRVGDQTRAWEEGRAFVFDDTIEHEAWNGSEAPRTVMIFDIWNPYLDLAERELVTALTDGVGAFYGSLPAYV